MTRLNTLEDLGYTIELENYRKEQKWDAFEVGRVISEHKDRYLVNNGNKVYESEIIGNLRFSATSRSDFPAVGDWVTLSEYDDDKALIHNIFPRKTIIERQAVGKHGEKQIIATNIDYAFIVQAVDRDFNINRIERYLTICHKAKVKAIIVLNKIDLISENELKEMIQRLKKRISNLPILAISNESNIGLDKLNAILETGKSYCLLGSSGVGKSTLLNKLLGTEMMATNSISESSNKGRHVTSHRELQVLDSGGIIIDNPGMREVGIGDSGAGLEKTFEKISQLSQECRFKDCTHTSEVNCAVIEAVEKGELDEASYENFLKMEREKDHFESTMAERRKKDKEFGKMVRTIKKEKKNKKF